MTSLRGVRSSPGGQEHHNVNVERSLVMNNLLVRESPLHLLHQLLRGRIWRDCTRPQETTDMVDATTKGTIDRTMLLAMGTMIGIPTH
jgi:hypothetical protein